MKKLLTALAVTAFGLAMATVGSIATNDRAYAAPGDNSADACIKYRDFGYMQGQNRARAEVKLDAGCGERKLVMKTWYAKSLDDGTQEFHDTQWLAYTGETVTLTPQDPWTPIKVQYGDKACFHQIDIVDVTNGDNDGDNTIVAAIVGGTKDCRPKPVYSCDALGVVQGANRTVTVNNFKVSATNATLHHVMLTWGDGSSLRVEGDATNATHQYTQDGTYNIQAVAYFSYTNKVGKTVVMAAKVSDACKASVTYKTQTEPGNQEVCNVTTGKTETIPEGPYDTTKYAPVGDERCKTKTVTVTSTTPVSELTATGPGAVVALFGAVSAAGAAGHYWFNRRRS